MKKNTTAVLVCMVTIVLFAGSCVGKKKYADAVSRHDTLQAENARLTTQMQEMQRNNTSLREQMDSIARIATTAGVQGQTAGTTKRMESMQQVMEQQRKAMSDIRQRMSEALANYKAEEVSVSEANGKVNVNLQERFLFTGGGTAINQKGRQALAKLAEVLNANPDVNVLILGHTGEMRGTKGTETDRMGTEPRETGTDTVSMHGRDRDRTMDTSMDRRRGKVLDRGTERRMAKGRDTAMDRRTDRTAMGKTKTTGKTKTMSKGRTMSRGMDTWSLSTNRATAIARVLTQTYRVDPSRVRVAAGGTMEAGEGATAQTGTMGRSTRIILEPRMDELMRLMQEDVTTTR